MAEVKAAVYRRSGRSRMFSIGTRLFVWYALITVLLRCPASLNDLDDSSPFICRPYFQARDYAIPYAQPYYDAYAAQYVDKARPYADTFNHRLYQPVSAVATGVYRKYASPLVAQAWKGGQREWERTVMPLLQTLIAEAFAQYQKYLGPYVSSAYAQVSPHVDRAYSAISPNVEKAQAIAHDQYEKVLVPSLEKSLPYLQVVYGQTQLYLAQYALPYSRFALDTTWRFLSRQIWPHIRVLYGRNVEPQLSKIRERLGSYRDGQKIEAAVDAIDEELSSSVVEPVSLSETSSTPLSSLASVLGMTSSHDSTTVSSSVSSSASSAPTPVNVTEDLKRWQKKFSVASDQGAQDLAKRISDISENHISTSAQGTGEAILIQLEEASSSTLSSLKSKIIDAVAGLPEESSDEDQDEAYASILALIRKAGNEIKSKAQELRMWKLSYDSELDSLVQEATDSTLDVIDGIRDLGLQEIGIRWANSEQVTWQDWAEYHKLKRTFDDWRGKVSGVAENNEAVKAAKQAGEDTEEKGMGVVQDTAQELARLKEVAKWKIHARDDSGDFSSKILPAAAARLGQKILDKAKSAVHSVTGTSSSQGMAESIISAASSSAEDAASSVSSTVVSPVQDAASSLGSSLSSGAARASDHIASSASSLSSRLSESGSSATTDIESSSSSLLSAMSSAASSVSPSASSPIASSLSSAMSAVAESILPSLAIPSHSSDGENAPLASSLSAALSSYSASAAEMAPSSASILSSSLSERIDSLMHQAGYSGSTLSMSASLSSATDAAGSSVESASSSASSLANKARDSVSSVTSAVGSSIGSATGPSISLAATAAPLGSALPDDIVNAASSASSLVQSQVEEAGSGYSSVTKKLASAKGEL